MFRKQSPAKSRLSRSNFADMRGRHAPIHKMKESTKQSITDHIESYHPSVSHYQRKCAPLRRYLSSGMIVAKNAFQLQRKTPRWKCFLWIVLKDLCVNENQFYNVRRKRMRRMRRVQVTWFPLEWSWTWSRDK